MIGLLAAGISESGIATDLAVFDLGRGAIAGALIVGAAFLVGYAAVRRSGLAVCAALMVAAAAALNFSWLGLTPWLSAKGAVFALGIFAAAGVVFLSAAIGASKTNPLLGGVMFTGALILAGLGAINFIDRIEVSGLMRWSVIAIGGFAVVLTLAQAVRGDTSARMVLPGLALAIAAPLIGPLGAIDGVATLAAHGVFTLGILAASLVALTDGFSPQSLTSGVANARHSFTSPDHRAAMSASAANASRERAEVVIDSQLGRVLDYAGVGIWDWSSEFIDQTESLPALLGADSNAPFTPDALRQFIHKDDLKKLETEVLAAEDGPFDVSLKLFNDRTVRMRGARAAAEDEGVLDRIVAFIEHADAKFAEGLAPALNNAKQEPRPEASAKKPDVAIENIVAVFQPIVSLSDMKTVGYEALARLNGKEGNTAQLIRAAAHAGKSGELALSMLRQAAEFLARERKANKAGEVFVAMNVSWTQMSDPAFAEAVDEVTKKYSLPKGTLVLELTEGEAIGNADAATPVFRKLKNMGAALAFDDFGAGFSCLSNVRKYDFDYIKIDKSFADDLEGKGDGSKIVGALAGMGKDLGLKVIIEGIESKGAAKTAAALGCTFGQGFALGRPAAAGHSDKPMETLRASDKKKSIARPVETDSPDKSSGDAIDLTVDNTAQENEAPSTTASARPMRWKSITRMGSR